MSNLASLFLSDLKCICHLFDLSRTPSACHKECLMAIEANRIILFLRCTFSANKFFAERRNSRSFVFTVQCPAFSLLFRNIRQCSGFVYSLVLNSLQMPNQIRLTKVFRSEIVSCQIWEILLFLQSFFSRQIAENNYEHCNGDQDRCNNVIIHHRAHGLNTHWRTVLSGTQTQLKHTDRQTDR